MNSSDKPAPKNEAEEHKAKLRSELDDLTEELEGLKELLDTPEYERVYALQGKGAAEYLEAAADGKPNAIELIFKRLGFVEAMNLPRQRKAFIIGRIDYIRQTL